MQIQRVHRTLREELQDEIDAGLERIEFASRMDALLRQGLLS